MGQDKLSFFRESVWLVASFTHLVHSQADPVLGTSGDAVRTLLAENPTHPKGRKKVGGKGKEPKKQV